MEKKIGEDKSPIRQQSVLFIDSDRELVGILSSFLALQKFKVAFSSKAREALFKMRNQSFNFIVLDPVNTDESFFFKGLEEFNHLKNKTEIIVSTRNLEYALPLKTTLNIRGILAKPFDLDQFWQILGS